MSERSSLFYEVDNRHGDELICTKALNHVYEGQDVLSLIRAPQVALQMGLLQVRNHTILV